MEITPEVIEQLKEANPDAELFKLSTPMPSGEVLVGVARIPTKAQYTMSREMVYSGDAAKKAAAPGTLFQSCVLYPSGSAKEQLVRRYPGIPEIWGGEIAEQAGNVQGTVVEKL